MFAYGAFFCLQNTIKWMLKPKKFACGAQPHTITLKIPLYTYQNSTLPRRWAISLARAPQAIFKNYFPVVQYGFYLANILAEACRIVRSSWLNDFLR